MVQRYQSGLDTLAEQIMSQYSVQIDTNKNRNQNKYKTDEQLHKIVKNDIIQIILNNHIWPYYLMADLDFLNKMRSKIVVMSKKSEFDAQIHGILGYVRNNLNTIDQQVYQLALQKLVNSIGDDHTQIQFKDRQNQQPLFAGFISDVQFFDDNSIHVLITFSVDKRIQIGDRVLKVDDISIQQFLDQRVVHFHNKTNSLQLNCKQACATMSIYNPFSPFRYITIQRSSRVKPIQVEVKFQKAISGIFPGGDGGLYGYINRQLLKTQIDTKIGTNIYKYAKLMHIQLHDFPMYGKHLNKLLSGLQSAKKREDLEWIVIDFRQNFGGSPIGLFFIVQLLMDKHLVKYIASCRHNIYSIAPEFLKQYKDQFVSPILSDPETDPQTKAFFQKQVQYFANKSATEDVVKIKSREQCNPTQPINIIKKIAKSILNGESIYKKIVLVTDYHCFSACIWSVNFLNMFPNVIVIGKQTGMTTGSGNSLQFTLPSKMASLYLPQMRTQLVGKINKSVLYKKTDPDIYLEDDIISDTESLLIWILENKNMLDNIFIKKSHQFSTK